MQSRVLLCLLCTVAAVTSSVSTAAAGRPMTPPPNTFQDNAFTFRYPHDWTSLGSAERKSFHTLFAHPFGLRGQITDLGGVQKAVPGTPKATLVLVIRFHCAADYRSIAGGQAAYFQRVFLQGLERSAQLLMYGPDVIGTRSAQSFEYRQGSGQKTIHAELFLVVPPNQQRLYMVYFITRPPKRWGSYLPVFLGIAESMKLH